MMEIDDLLHWRALAVDWWNTHRVETKADPNR